MPLTHVFTELFNVFIRSVDDDSACWFLSCSNSFPDRYENPWNSEEASDTLFSVIANLFTKVLCVYIINCYLLNWNILDCKSEIWQNLSKNCSVEIC
jgi:hypothetical protein